MTSRGSSSRNPGPTSAPSTPPIISELDSINNHPEDQEYPGDTLKSDIPLNQDIPGPSNTFIPRQPSPPLPDFSNPSSRRDRTTSSSLRDDLNSNSNSDSESEDEVAYTLPIYLSATLSPSLNLFQYPLQHRSLKAPTWAEDRGKKITSRVKENVGRIEIEVPVDAGANVWRDERARDLGFVNDVRELNGNGTEVVGGISGKSTKDKEKDKKGKSGKKKDEKWGDKIRLTSEVLPNATGYYSGIVHDGALHLHPINRTLQFRTSLTYLDDYDQKLRQQSTITRQNPNGDEDAQQSRPSGNTTTNANANAGSASTRPNPPVIRHTASLRKEDENDGSGSIKDFRNHMWATVQAEEEDKWTSYEWREGEDGKVLNSLTGLLVVEDGKKQWMACQTRPLDYLNKE